MSDPKIPSAEMNMLAEAASMIASVIRHSGATPGEPMAVIKMPKNTLLFLNQQWGSLSYSPLTINTSRGTVQFEASEDKA